VAAELGVAGLLLLAWLLWALARLAVERRAGRAERLVLGLCLFTILVHSLFYASFFEDPLTYGLAGLLAVEARGRVSERRRRAGMIAIG
jgi:hypothetical protein